MKQYLHKTPIWIQKLYPQFTWKVPTTKKELFLTFDDGPIPDVTEFVLEELKRHNAKATFFSVGENLLKHPEIAKEVIEEGHVIGNHTFNHLKGWQTDQFRYLKNVLKCEEAISQIQKSHVLFRPPYGRIKRSQAASLSKFKIVMWNRLAWDFSPNLNIDQAIHHLNDDAPAGSIFVFHDNAKSFKNLKSILPEVLAHYLSDGYTFSSLP